MGKGVSFARCLGRKHERIGVSMKANRLTIPEIKRLTETADERELETLERTCAADERKGVATLLEAAHKRLEAKRAETERVQALYTFERKLGAERGHAVIVGLDEVGRGPLAGPLCVGAVILPDEPLIEGLNDSKQVPELQREKLASQIKSVARAWAVEYVWPATIDEVGMAKALRLAFQGALKRVEESGVEAGLVLIDGNPLHIDPRELNIVKGDAKCASIAAASLVAKVERDALMVSMDERYPGYGFAQNKGYGTKAHKEAIQHLGLSDFHRRSFCSEFLQQSLF